MSGASQSIRVLTGILFGLLTGDASTAQTDSGGPAETGEPTRPNVLFIVLDDLNDWVGPLGGHPQVETPHIDKLAARGTTFLNAHAQAPACNPSRTSFLTGLRPSTLGVYGLETWFRVNKDYRQQPTLIQTFMRNDYRTMTTGKVFHDGYPPKARRSNRSEVEVFGYEGEFGPRPRRRLVPGLEIDLVDWGIFPARDRQQDDSKVAQWAAERLSNLPRRKPWFLCVGFRHPHVPLYATQKWFDLYPEQGVVMPLVKRDDRDDIPRSAWYLNWRVSTPRLAWFEENRQWTNFVRSYLASISFVDEQVGRVLRALDDSGQADNTIVVLFSDHGYHLGEKSVTGKHTLWERSTRVPLIIAGPGLGRDQKTNRPAELLDLYPTLAELAGLEAPDNLEGHSLVPQLHDPTAPRDFPAITTHSPGNHAVRDERYRYIRYADGGTELYDIEQDPYEWTNLAGDPDHAAIAERLAGYVPREDAPALPGARIVEYVDGVPTWDGKPIAPDAPVPGP